MNSTVLELKNLYKKINNKVIIKDFSLKISSGEIVGFVGPNGAGKTTTMRMIVGLVSPTSGTIKINGHDVQNDFTKAMNYVGGVIEGPQLYGYLTGYQNLLHYARMVSGITKKRIKQVASLVGLTKRLNDKVKTYSLGMRQRLGLAQALLHSPSLLILDEPTNGLDPSGIREINHYLRKLADEEGVSVFISSHILPEMEQVCDRILFIQNGKFVDEHYTNQEDDLGSSVPIEFIVEPITKAKEIVRHRYPGQKVIIKDKHLIIDIEPELISEVNKEFVSQGIAVFGIRRIEKRLEDRYLEVTGGKTGC